MQVKNYLQRIQLTPGSQLQTLVENRRVFNLNTCELNVFESYQQAYHIPLTFNDFVITSMVRGKKIMHLMDKPAFDYLPGETVIVPAGETMVIDFPEAASENPTQCIALAIDATYINSTLDYLNEYYGAGNEQHQWQLHCNQYHFENDTDVTSLINKLIGVCSSSNASRDIYADLHLKELLIRLIQSQHLQQVDTAKSVHQNKSRLHYVLHYIHEHLTEKIAIDALSRKAYVSRNIFYKWFKEQFGITPLDYINRERVKLAKQLLVQQQNSVQAVSNMCGFSDVNYFIRVFKKTEGTTPKAYQSCYLF
ncbi:transcriptional regulator, AraC family [Filimonas lacunae]|uniref:Transcriptional regulator, AraC family n=1 Tax=Filimonas lacunae TaxID=477680 RepID=A0A1N7LGM7_9BACT|nr:AraC family transcriptional regulator [Filimonas lacunae]SIS72979.1 transcriptional regulator, AraC family [Filimonas lacunae]